MIWHVNAGIPKKMLVNLPDVYDSSNLVSNQFGSENTAIQIYFKSIFIFGLGSYFWRRENKFQETVPENSLARSVALDFLVSGGSHDLVSHLILSVLVCQLVKINFENLGSQNKLIYEYPINVRSGYTRLEGGSIII
jgi:hypothetical protein